MVVVVVVVGPVTVVVVVLGLVTVVVMVEVTVEVTVAVPAVVIGAQKVSGPPTSVPPAPVMV